MYRRSTLILVLIGLAVLLSVWLAIRQYNALQSSDEIANASWGQVINQYRRRADLIPNVVAGAKAYAAHESAVLADVAAARAKVSGLPQVDGRDQEAVARFMAAQAQVSAQLTRLLAAVERYPDLKANSLFQDLMVQLEGTENRISYARQRYIEAIAAYNIEVRNFPGNLLAKAIGFETRPNFSDVDEHAIAKAPAAALR